MPSVLEMCGSFRISVGHMEAQLYPDLLMLSGYSGYSGSGSRICSRTGEATQVLRNVLTNWHLQEVAGSH